MSNKALFLDRDGIINHDAGYAYKPEQIEFVPGIFSLCKKAQQKGYRIIVVTNQSGIARGYYSETDFQQLSAWIKQQFSQRFISISHTYHCPHHPAITGSCACRKPRPGMLLAAIKRYKITADSSMMIGDKNSDMQAAKAANIGTRVLFNRSKHRYQSPAATKSIQALHQAQQYLG
jgi:D-glycero-D-manno-heptose 1,7-bisphosphate phosphatase